jgi:4-hydroxy-3-polyprenylbenzoate decarboxylase/2,5-furandicarboxylate decarboxylase 1
MLKDLRSFLNLLEQKHDLTHISRPTSPRFEIAAGMRKTSDVEGPALYFDNVIGSSIPVVAALYSVRRRVICGLESSEAEIHQKITHGIQHPIPPRIVSNGSCKDVILIGKDARFSLFPICTHNRNDAGAFITIGLVFARHPEYGNNVSISRIQIFDDHTACIRSVAPQHLAVYYSDAEKRGEPLEVAITVGNDPYVTMCSQIAGSIYVDELTVAGGWMGEPVEVVKCETSDLCVPATSEIVFEGELRPGERRLEGPFGEFPGYYQGVTQQAVFHLKAITHRKNPIYVAALTGPPNTDNHVMVEVPREAVIYERIRQICPTVRDVCVTKGGIGLHIAISIRPTYTTQARDVMLAALTTERIRPKLVIVVDEDIDVRNPEKIEWAMATRFQADRDLVVIPNQVGAALDPSTPAPRVGALMGIDATRPLGANFPEVAEVPGVENFQIPGWTDVRED